MCRAYVDVIDLTNEEPSNLEEHSDMDGLSLPEISLSSAYDRYVRHALYMYVVIVNT